jgi:transcriptional regulator with XRE-family HTH domain
MNILNTLSNMEDWQSRFKDYLADNRLSQSEIAGRIGVTQGALGHWLSGRREINLSAFIALCRASGANAQFILFGEGESRSALLAEIRKLLPPETPPAPAEPKKYKKNKQLA